MKMEKDELKLSRVLSRMEGESPFELPSGKGTITIRYINYSAGGSGCPDSLLILKVSMPVMGRVVSLQIPILVEAEKAGINAAIEDLDKFCERSVKGTLEGGGSSFVEIPMLVASQSSSIKNVKKRRTLMASFNIQEIKI